MAEQWMSIVEYARTFSISDMTVRRRIKNGKLNAVLRDGKYFIQVNGASAGDSINSISHSFTPPPASKPYGASSISRSERSGELHGWDSQKDRVVSDNHSSEPSVEPESDKMQALLNYCERSVNRINSIERHLKDSYQNKYLRLESEVRQRDLEISNLKQQVEDLQILIKMYDGEAKV